MVIGNDLKKIKLKHAEYKQVSFNEQNKQYKNNKSFHITVSSDLSPLYFDCQRFVFTTLEKKQIPQTTKRLLSGIKFITLKQTLKYCDFQRPKGETECDFENINAHTTLIFYFIFILSSDKQRSCLTAGVFTEGLTKELNIKIYKQSSYF